MGKKSQNNNLLVKSNDTCSPIANSNFKRFGTCIPPNLLRQVARNYNATSPHKPINAKQPIDKLVSDLKNQLHCTNSDNQCWIKSQAANGLYSKLKAYYRPVMPKSWLSNPREWLSNVDIQNVMTQYEDAHTSFKFVGVVSVDFYTAEICKFYSICEFNVFDFLASGKTQLGLVINLDTYYGKGSHWVSIFANFNPNSQLFGFCYYDSGANKPPSQVYNFLKQIKMDAQLFFKDKMNETQFKKSFKTKYNSKQHQKKNTECGMFAMLFIIFCLEHKNKSYAKICNILHVGSDDFVNQYRNVLFIK